MMTSPLESSKLPESRREAAVAFEVWVSQTTSPEPLRRRRLPEEWSSRKPDESIKGGMVHMDMVLWREMAAVKREGVVE